ncbi:hypothetical protein JCM1840_007191, partial [Sporobolomyces johnsonii]
PAAAVAKKATSPKVKNAKPAAAVQSLSVIAPNRAPPSDGGDSDFDDSDFDMSDFDDSDSDLSDSDLSDGDMSDAEPFVRVYVNMEDPQPVSQGMGELFAELAQPMLKGLDWRTLQFPDSARFSEVLDD